MRDPISDFIERMFNLVPQQAEAFLATSYPKLAGALVTPVSLLAMIWLAVKVIRVHGGQDPANIWPWVRGLLAIFFVFWGLSWGGLASKVYHLFVELRDDTIRLLLDGNSIVQYVDTIYSKFGTAAKALLKAGIGNIGAVLMGATLEAINGLLVMVVLLLKASSDVGMAITMTLLPLFLPAVLWEQTRSYFMNWVSAMIKFALIGILLGVSIKLSFQFVQTLIDQTTNGLVPDSSADDVGAAIIVEGFVLLFVAFGLRPLASALASSGAAGGGALGFVAGLATAGIAKMLSGVPTNPSAAPSPAPNPQPPAPATPPAPSPAPASPRQS